MALHDVRIGSDGLARCAWADNHPTLLGYHDHEWGRVVLGEHDLYERVVLKGFQAGLSCLIVLQKRHALRRAFAGFVPDAVAAMSDTALDALADDPDVIRNRAKIVAARTNARACIALRREGGLSQLVWRHQLPDGATHAAQVGAAVSLAGALKAAGFRFVGPTSVHALLQATGVVPAHAAACAMAPPQRLPPQASVRSG